MTCQKLISFGLRILVILAIVALATACDSPEQREAKYLERGKRLFETGNLTKAQIEFRNALQINPKGVDGLYYLALIDGDKGDIRKAYAKFMEVLIRDQDHVGVLIKLGQYSFLANRLDEALDRANTVLDLEHDNAEAHALRAAVFLRRNELARAQEAAERALAIDPANVRAASALAGILKVQGRMPRAIQVLDRTLELRPKERGLRLVKAQLHLERGEFPEVERIYRELILIRPDELAYRKDLARLLVERGRDDDAEKLLRDTVNEFPDKVEPKLLLANHLIMYRGSETAERVLLDFVAQTPEEYELRFYLARVYARHKEHEKARELYLSIIEDAGLEPAGLNARSFLAELYYKLGDREAATRTITEVLQEDPQNNAVLMLRGRIGLVERDYEAAVIDFRSVLRNEPDSKQATRLLAQAHLAAGETELAVASLQSLLELDPRDYVARQKLAGLLAGSERLDADLTALGQSTSDLSVLRSTAEILIRRKSWAEAEAVARRIAAHADGQALGHKILGDVFRATARYEDALSHYHEALKLEPRWPALLRSAAMAYNSAGQTEKGVQFLEELAAEQPDNAAAYNALGEIFLREQKDLEVTEYAFRAALERQPSWPLPYLNLARLFASSGRHDQAIEVLREGLARNPIHKGLALALGEAYQMARDYAATIHIYEQMLDSGARDLILTNNLAALIADFKYKDEVRLKLALRLAEPFGSSSDPVLLDTLGWVHYRAGNNDAALRYLEQAARAGPATPQRRYHLGMVYLRGGQIDSARQELEAAVAAGTHYPGVEAARGVLQGL